MAIYCIPNAFARDSNAEISSENQQQIFYLIRRKKNSQALRVAQVSNDPKCLTKFQIVHNMIKKNMLYLGKLFDIFHSNAINDIYLFTGN